MSWAKLDDNFHMHPRTLEVGNAGAGLIARMMSWSCNHLTDGIVTGYAAVTLAGSDGVALIEKLVAAGWLEPREGGSYYIHNFHKRNPSAVIEKERIRKNAEKQDRFRKKSTRVSGGTHSTNQPSNQVTPAESNQVSNQVTTGVSNPVPVPVPVNTHTHRAHTREASEVPEMPEPARTILAAIASHEPIRLAAKPALAEHIAGTVLASGKPLEWILEAIADAARDAGADAASGSPHSPQTMSRLIARYCAKARAPRDAGRAGGGIPRGAQSSRDSDDSGDAFFAPYHRTLPDEASPPPPPVESRIPGVWNPGPGFKHRVVSKKKPEGEVPDETASK